MRKGQLLFELERQSETATLTQAEKNLAQAQAQLDDLTKGKRPFGLIGVLGKSEEKKKIEAVKVLGNSPASIEDWLHVLEYISLQKQLRMLAIRWNSISPEILVESLPGVEPEHATHAHGLFAIYEKVTDLSAKTMTLTFS